jgi:hypothetical protein
MTLVQDMGRFDSLLEWASEMAEGSWAAWRDACLELQVEPTWAMQDLAALGHVEVDWAKDRFSCPPSTAAFLHRSSGSMLVTGARPRGLLDDLFALEATLQDLDFVIHEPAPQSRGPRTVLIEAELDDVEELCQAAGLDYVFDPASRIADALPQASLDHVANHENWPPRDEVPRRRFDPQTMRFRVTSDADETGLWWYDGYRREEAWIRNTDGWWQVPTREYAPFLAHPQVVFLRYLADHRQLFVPPSAPLPPLQARAATLASGRLPRRASGSGPAAWIYENVSGELADSISASLDTTLGEA